MDMKTYRHGAPTRPSRAATDTNFSRFVRTVPRGLYQIHAARKQDAFAAMTAVYISKIVNMPRTIQEVRRVS